MQELIKKHETKLRFGLIGGLNTLLDFGLLFAFSSILGVPKLFANILSTSVPFVFSFFANKKYTFKSSSKENIVREMVLFTVVTLFGLWVIQGAIIYFLSPVIVNIGFSQDVSLMISKLIATVFSLIWNYLLYSRVVFTHKTNSK
jgi:putative flippase GtrA